MLLLQPLQKVNFCLTFVFELVGVLEKSYWSLSFYVEEQMIIGILCIFSLEMCKTEKILNNMVSFDVLTLFVFRKQNHFSKITVTSQKYAYLFI